MRVLPIAWLLVASSVGLACSLTALDGFSGGAAPGVAEDAGAGAEAGRDDASLPGTPTVDGSANADGQADSGQPLSPCKTAPATAFFCDDFDVDPFGEGWSAEGSPVGPSGVSFASTPRSLSATLPSRGPGRPDAFLSRRLPSSTRTIRLEYDLRIEESTRQGAVDLGNIHFSSLPFWSLSLRYERSGPAAPHSLTFYEYGDSFGSNPQLVRFESLGAPPRIGGFFHVVLVAQIGATSSSASIEVDGVRHEFPVAGHLYQSAFPGVAVGITSSDGAGEPFQAFVDNVLAAPNL